MNKCLSRLHKVGFKRLLSEEGAAVLGLLEEIDKAEPYEDREWFTELFNETKAAAKEYPCYLKGNIADVSDFPENAIKILRLQAQGFSTVDISKKLSLNTDTVKYHIKQNYKKLGVSGKIDAVLFAKNLGII